MTRADCVDGPRPCAYVSCRHHLGLGVTPSGIVVFHIGVPQTEGKGRQVATLHPLAPDAKWEEWGDAFVEALAQAEDTCALDSSEKGGRTLEEVGEVLNFTRERSRQLEQVALTKLRRNPALKSQRDK